MRGYHHSLRSLIQHRLATKCVNIESKRGTFTIEFQCINYLGMLRKTRQGLFAFLSSIIYRNSLVVPRVCINQLHNYTWPVTMRAGSQQSRDAPEPTVQQCCSTVPVQSRSPLSLADRQQSVNNHAPVIAIAAKQIVVASDFQRKLRETNAFPVDVLNIAVLYERGFGSFLESDELLW